MSSFKYEKPEARELGSLSAAEGFCAPGGGASGSTCSNGPADTGTCGTGGAAATIKTYGGCNTGTDAANCFSGATAGG